MLQRRHLQLRRGRGLPQVTQPVSGSLVVRAQASGLLDQCSSRTYPAVVRICIPGHAVSYIRLSLRLYYICGYASDHKDPSLPPSSCLFALFLFFFSSLLLTGI